MVVAIYMLCLSKFEINKLLDDIPRDREYAIRIFECVGFKRAKSEELGEVMELINKLGGNH